MKVGGHVTEQSRPDLFNSLGRFLIETRLASER